MQPCYLEAEFENAFDEKFEPDVIRIIYEIAPKFKRVISNLTGMGYRLNRNEESHILDRRYGAQIVQKVFKKFLSHGEQGRRYAQGVVYYSAVLSRIYWITDSGLVSNILKEAYAYNYFPAMFEPIFVSGIRSVMGDIPDSSTKRGNSTMNFFLHHANKARLQFNGVRFQDLLLYPEDSRPPVFSAVVNEKPHLLLLLLRFGAKVEVTNSRPDDWNLPKLLRHLIQTLRNSLSEDLQHSNPSGLDHTTVMSNHPAAECVNILLRVVPQIRMGEINYPLMKFKDGTISGSVCSQDFIRLLSEKNIVPEFVNRYLEPSRLSHLCRCVIRNSLNSSWNLPYGIDLLPLPKLLKSYLSIALD